MKLTGENRDALYYRNIDIKNRTIFFCPWQPNEQMMIMDEDSSWEVNDYTIQNALKGLYVLENINSDPVTIIWMSYGGDWDAGMALYD